MTVELPLGKRESQTLEFKQAEVLDRPEKVGREVVAMLNAEGGEVWIGVREEEGRAVELQPIANAERRADALLDSLVDSISPRLTTDEIQVEAVETLLRLIVRPQRDRRPYALVRSGGWQFLRRIGTRMVTMTREEIEKIFGRADVEPGQTAKAALRVAEARRQAAERLSAGLWLRLESVRPLDIDTQSQFLDGVITDPRVSGNRRGGWNFATAYERPRVEIGAIEWGDQNWGGQSRAERKGGMSFEVAAHRLRLRGERNEIWPLVLLEYLVSAFRIARRIYEGHLENGDQVLADLAFFRAGDWRLRPGTPGPLFLAEPHPFPYADLLLPEPEIFPGHLILKEPDRCGFRLGRQVYEAYGLSESDMPQYFDQENRRMFLPE